MHYLDVRKKRCENEFEEDYLSINRSLASKLVPQDRVLNEELVPALILSLNTKTHP